jgi:hypothetical protein
MLSLRPDYNSYTEIMSSEQLVSSHLLSEEDSLMRHYSQGLDFKQSRRFI